MPFFSKLEAWIQELKELKGGCAIPLGQLRMDDGEIMVQEAMLYMRDIDEPLKQKSN